MKSTFAKIALFFGIILLLGIGTLFVIGQFYSDKLVNLAIETAKEKAAIDFEINGEVELSLIQDFPQASIIFNDVFIPDNQKDTLAIIGQFKLLLNLTSIWSDEIKIDEVLLENGLLNIKKNVNGVLNIPSSEKTSTSSDSSALSLELKQILIQNFDVSYDDKATKTIAKGNIDDLVASLNLGKELTKITLNVQSDWNKLQYDTIFIEKQIPLDIRANLSMNSKMEHIHLEQFDFDLNENSFTAKGELDILKTKQVYDIEFTGKDISLEKILHIIPSSFKSSLAKIEANGKLNLEGSVKGTATSKVLPQIKVNAQFRNGAIKYEGLQSPFERLSFDVKYTNGASKNARTSSVEIKDFTARFNDKPFEGKFKLINFDNPVIDLKFSGDVDIADFNSLTGEKIELNSGNLHCKNFSITGTLKNILNTKTITQVSQKGELVLSDFEMEYDGTSFEIPYTVFTLNDNLIQLESFELNALDSKITSTGTLKNFVPFLLRDSNQVVLQFDWNIKSESIDVNEIKAFTDNLYSDEAENKSKSSEINTSFLKYVQGTFKSDILELTYDDLTVNNLKSSFKLEEDQIKIYKLSSEAFAGTVGMNGKIMFPKSEGVFLDGFFECKNVDIHRALKEMDDFGQDYISYKNLKGELDANIELSIGWNKEMTFLEQDALIKMDLEGRNGELMDYEPMEAMSSFVKIKELKSIRFNTLKNTLTISDGKLIIPVMFINSSAMNLTLGGIHTFDNRINYQVKVNLGNVLWGKFRKFNSKRDFTTNKDKKGGFNIYVVVHGTVDDPKFDYDKKTVKNKIQEDLSAEREELINLFKQEFKKEIQENNDYELDELEFIEFED